METPRWEDIKDRAKARQTAMAELQEAQSKLSDRLTHEAFKQLRARGLNAVAQLVSNGRDAPFDDASVAADDQADLWEVLMQEFERPAYVALVLYSAWLAETIPTDLLTLDASVTVTQPLPTCPPETRARFLQESAPEDDSRPHPEIIDLVIERIETAEGLVLPGLGTVKRGQLTVDAQALKGFRDLHARRVEPTAG